MKDLNHNHNRTFNNKTNHNNKKYNNNNNNHKYNIYHHLIRITIVQEKIQIQKTKIIQNIFNIN